MDEVRIVPTETRYRRRRSTVARFLANVILFIVSLIPMCIVAWRIDLLGLNVQQPQVQGVQQPVEQAPPKAVRQQPPRIGPIPKEWFQPADPEPEETRDGPPRVRMGDRDALREEVSEALIADGGLELPDADDEMELDAPDVVGSLDPDEWSTVTLTLGSNVYRVTVIPEFLDDVLVDVAVPSEFAVTSAGDAPDGFTLALANVPLGESESIVFATVSGATVGCEVRTLRRARSAIVEIRPKYVLPGGAERVLSTTVGGRDFRALTRTIADAETVSLSAMRSAIDEAKRNHQRLERQAAQNPHLQAMYGRELGRSAGTIANMEQQYAQAQTLVSSLPALRRDAKAMTDVSEYAAQKIVDMNVAVRFHRDGETLVADVR